MKNIWNYEPNGAKEDYSELASEVQPGMGMKPKEILERFTSGRPMGHVPGFYEFNGDAKLIKPMKDITRYDKIDRIEYYRSIEKELLGLKKSIDDKATKNTEGVLQDKIAELQAQIDAENEEVTP